MYYISFIHDMHLDFMRIAYIYYRTFTISERVVYILIYE